MKYINIDFKNSRERIEEFDKVTLTIPEKRFLFGCGRSAMTGFLGKKRLNSI